MAIKQSVIFSAFFVLSACATTLDSSKDIPQANKADDRLTARNLSAGECGMFVWTADNARRFIFFSRADQAEASWWNGSNEVTIARVSSEGFASYGQPPEQIFRMTDGGKLMLALSDPEDINSGTRFKSGAITLAGADGWEKVVPVIGLAGCQTAGS